MNFNLSHENILNKIIEENFSNIKKDILVYLEEAYRHENV